MTTIQRLYTVSIIACCYDSGFNRFNRPAVAHYTAAPVAGCRDAAVVNSHHAAARYSPSTVSTTARGGNSCVINNNHPALCTDHTDRISAGCGYGTASKINFSTVVDRVNAIASTVCRTGNYLFIPVTALVTVMKNGSHRPCRAAGQNKQHRRRHCAKRQTRPFISFMRRRVGRFHLTFSEFRSHNKAAHRMIPDNAIHFIHNHHP